MVDFGAIIGESAEWTKQVLFKPFNLKKWLILAFIAIMAGAMSNGCNFNSGGGGSNDHHYESQQQEQGTCPSGANEAAPGTSACAPAANTDVPSPGVMGVALTIIAVVATFFIALVLILMWLGSRFSFVFLEDVIKNDASIKAPFGANADAGNSYFRFNIVFMLVFLSLLGSLIYIFVVSLIKSGLIDVSNPSSEQLMGFLLMAIPVLLLGFILFVITGLISLITIDLVLPIMYRERIRTLAAWGKAWALVRKNVGNLIVYILIKVGLGIGAGIAYLLLFIAGFIVVVIPMGLIAFALWLISKTMPAAAIFPYWLVIGLILTPVCIFLLYCLMALNLPFAVFFRTYSLKFLERLDPQYAFIKTEKPVAAQ